ncbi:MULTISPECIES: HIT family protein [Marinobacter]|uniref:HIT family protein n=1 Tax=Marinobacter TaxID=2742 RepID=UPI001B2E85A9|nr:HIT family protein [Marinobacter sp.]MBO6812227.1 HIT family protein [Marinobacter sp.]MBO6873525.1 HIT family protein [Marinobacter sp.]
MTEERCPFCNIIKDRILLENGSGYVISDGFPVSPGHSLIIPRDHYADFFDIPETVRYDLFRLVDDGKKFLDSQLSPNGYNIGINSGAAAGQTVPHLHIHLIPRFNGDQADPRGGIRWIFPCKANYWS